MSLFNEEEQLLEIVTSKYALMDLNELRDLCRRLNVELSYGLKKEDIVFHIIPEILDSEDFLEDFYNGLEPLQQEILKFIVNYNGKDVIKRVKKVFNFNITLTKKANRDIYVWWLELFMDENKMDDTLKEYYFKFLHDEKLKKEINGKRAYKVKNKEIKVIKKEVVEQYLDDIQNQEIRKYDFNHNLKSYKLFKNSHQNMIENMRIFYLLSKEKKIVITQKHQFAVRTTKLMNSSLSLDEELHTWFVNFLVKLKLLKLEKIVIPTKRFDTIIKLNDGDFLKEIYKKFISLNQQEELMFAPFAVRVGEGNSSIQNLRNIIIKIIKKSDTTKWISCDSIVEQVPITAKTLTYLKNGNRYVYGLYHYNQYGRKELQYNQLSDLKVTIRYFVKAFIGVINRLSICDIAFTSFASYVKADLELLSVTGEHDREFTNIEYFKLSEIGLYCLEINNSFQSENDFSLILDPYLLELQVDKPSNLSQIFLVNMTTKVTDTKYRVDFLSFMKNINSVEEYKNMKQIFLEKSRELPKNWQDFFAILDERIESASIVAKDTILIKLQKNRDILHLIATNKKLQSKILKADNLHIVVYKKDLAVVKNIFKECGIII